MISAKESFNQTATDILFETNEKSSSASGIVLRAMEQYAEQVKPKWISRKKGLPNEGESVLIYTPKIEPSIKVATYSYNTKKGRPYFFNAEFADIFIVKVTHWMPLPKAPVR